MKGIAILYAIIFFSSFVTIEVFAQNISPGGEELIEQYEREGIIDTTGSGIGSDESTIGIIIVVIIIIIVIAIAASRRGKPEVGERKGFSESVKKEVLKKQDHKCNICNRLLDVVDYDHIDGNRSNNDVSNCQALCPNCHAKKSRKSQMRLND